MGSLSDLIEQYIAAQLDRSDEGRVAIRRSHVAELFQCAPSQVSYVLETRFTVERGYVIETRRGGGGFIRIIQIPAGDRRELAADLSRLIGDAINGDRAGHCLMRLKDNGLLGEREYRIMRAAVSREALPLNLPARDIVRARVLRAMIAVICSREGEISK